MFSRRRVIVTVTGVICLIGGYWYFETYHFTPKRKIQKITEQICQLIAEGKIDQLQTVKSIDNFDIVKLEFVLDAQSLLQNEYTVTVHRNRSPKVFGDEISHYARITLINDSTIDLCFQYDFHTGELFLKNSFRFGIMPASALP